LRILIISSYFGNVIGGALNFIKKISRELTSRGHTVILLLDRRYYELFSETDFNIIWFSSTKISSYSPSLSFVKILSKIDVDIIHLHGFMSFQIDAGAIIGHIRKIPIILTPHGSLMGYDHLYDKFLDKIPYKIHNAITLKLATRYSKFIIPTSDAEFDDCIKFGITNKKIKLIPLAFNSLENWNKKELKQKNRLLFVGRIVPLKNLEILLKSIQVLKKDFPTIQLTIVGDEVKGRIKGDEGYKQKLVELIKELNINENVKFKGWKTGKELWDEYKKSELFILASTYENFCLPLLEAATFGIPLISSNVGIAQKLIGKNQGGNIIYELNANDYAKKIKELLEDKERYSECSEYIKKITKNFTIKSIVNEYEKIFIRIKKNG
jgi:glycosyltransferase involved in cell wall biosynthesis